MFKIILVTVILAVFLAFYLKPAQTLENILEALLKQENAAKVHTQARIAVGYGACKDIFVNSNDVIGDLRPQSNQLIRIFICIL